MRLLIDGDSCPGLNIISQLVNKYEVEAYIYCDYTHNIEDDNIKVIQIDKGYQSVDMKLLSILKEDDILITNDYGLASLSLLKNVTVINYKGEIYNKDNIDILLNRNYINKKLRNMKIHTKGPSKRSKDDDQSLYETLNSLLSRNIIL